MIKTAVARRYAKALFGLLGAADIETTRAGLTQLAHAVADSKSLKHVLASPAFGFEEKRDVLTALSHRLGCPSVVDRFLTQLIKKNRVGFLPDIAHAFAQLADERKHTKRVHVASAKALSASDQDHLRARLREVLRQEVDLSVQTDPSLLAGLRIRIGSTVFDSSVRTRLAAMRTAVTKE
ncbi:ATP synthase F1 subunit delta [Candidatus Nitrospira bockiana]